MSQDFLGLFDTPPSRRQVRIGLLIVGLFAAFLFVLPFRDVRLPEIRWFVPLVDVAVVPSELIAAAMLFSQAAVFRSAALTVLGAVYLYMALLLIPHALTFPGAFAPSGLLGAGANTTAWIVVFRQPAYPIGALLYIAFKRANSTAPSGTRRAAGVAVGVIAAIALAAGVTILTTVGQGLLAPTSFGRTDAIRLEAAVFGSLVLALYILATAVLFRTRSSVLDMWLLVGLSGFLVQILLMITIHDRFTAGWYALYVMALFSQQVVTLALIAESNRLYARLALATSARNRERESRLMSLDALAAAISHEAGQPLTAAITGAMAGMRWLNRTPPDVERAAKSMRDTLDAARRTAAVMKSVRAMFAKQPSMVAEFNLNELVRATVSLLDRELAGGQVSLELALDEALPPIVADRGQVQQVLVNLFANAIESVGAMQDRPRHITVRTRALEGRDVLLEVSDNGGGIAPDATEQIFEAYFTTKATGIGIGLSLSRIIVEACGGRLWASSAAHGGASFHLQLPRSDGLVKGS